ncbi:tetratricopeptide repeat protein, partial [uncultured Muribaculum sp.]|uniref:tetratricopeptide repeat protein n=1 Tax=uncultured Muribaculum sp. TaxID=1918613 RepID=UPI0026756E47
MEKDLPTYLSLLKRSIKAGNNRAILYLAKETLFGWSARPNPLKGIELLKKAVEANIPEAYSVMGQMYWEGNDIPQDMDKAVECYNKAISLGYMEAYADMSNLYMYEPNTFKTKDPQKGIEWLMKGAEYEEPSCLSAIALCYYFGTGVAQNYSNALKWFRKAAGAGDGFSCYFIGVMYYNGEGVDEDDKLAWDWFKRGAAMFQSNCFYMLGVMCRDSNSPEGKNEACIKYFEEAANLGGVGRKESLLGLYEIFRTKELEDYIILKDCSNFQEYSWAQKDDKRAMKYLKRAAENED